VTGPAWTRQDAARLVDAYREGTLSESDATRLADAIRAREPAGQWFLEELSFAGGVAEAVDPTSGTAFVQSSRERWLAEQDADRFVEAWERRREALRARPGEDRGSAGMAGGGESEASGDPAATRRVGARPRRRPGYWPVAAAVAVMVGSLAATWLVLLAGQAPRVGEVVGLSAGAAVLREGQTLPATASIRLTSGDRVTTPPGGWATIRLDLGSQRGQTLELGGDADVEIAPPDGPAGAAARVMIRSGEASVTIAGEAASATVAGEGDAVAIVLRSPHGEVRLVRGRCSMEATPTRTVAEIRGLAQWEAGGPEGGSVAVLSREALAGEGEGEAAVVVFSDRLETSP